MDARERLRLYLEQRRDAGESELVLDSLSVEEVMRLLGAGVIRPAEERTTARVPERPVRPGAPARGDVPADRAVTEDAPPRDWREALRALDVSPDEPSGRAAPTPGNISSLPRPPVVRGDAERAPAPASPSLTRDVPPAAPPAPAMTSPPPDSAPREATHALLPLEQVPAGLVVGSPAHEHFFGPESPWGTLDALAEATRHCQACSLYKTARQAVPGEGNPDADFVCVGEAPGASEDEQGRPFVGPAGQLLTKILAAIDLSRDDVFICNVLKHRPPGNRNPTPAEVAACSPFLVRQIEILRPKVILALGTFAAQTLLQTREPIGKLRGRIHRYYGVPLIVTYHPAALLRNPAWKRPTWEDVQLARRIFDRARDA